MHTKLIISDTWRFVRRARGYLLKQLLMYASIVTGLFVLGDAIEISTTSPLVIVNALYGYYFCDAYIHGPSDMGLFGRRKLSSDASKRYTESMKPFMLYTVSVTILMFVFSVLAMIAWYQTEVVVHHDKTIQLYFVLALTLLSFIAFSPLWVRLYMVFPLVLDKGKGASFSEAFRLTKGKSFDVIGALVVTYGSALLLYFGAIALSAFFHVGEGAYYSIGSISLNIYVALTGGMANAMLYITCSAAYVRLKAEGIL